MITWVRHSGTLECQIFRSQVIQPRQSPRARGTTPRAGGWNVRTQMHPQPSGRRMRDGRVESDGVKFRLGIDKNFFYAGAGRLAVVSARFSHWHCNMSRLTLSQIQNVLPAAAPKHEHLLLEIESTDHSSVGLVIRYRRASELYRGETSSSSRDWCSFFFFFVAELSTMGTSTRSSWRNWTSGSRATTETSSGCAITTIRDSSILSGSCFKSAPRLRSSTSVFIFSFA